MHPRREYAFFVCIEEKDKSKMDASQGTDADFLFIGVGERWISLISFGSRCGVQRITTNNSNPA